jgi:hypothetical protein
MGIAQERQTKVPRYETAEPSAKRFRNIVEACLPPSSVGFETRR